MKTLKFTLRLSLSRSERILRPDRKKRRSVLHLSSHEPVYKRDEGVLQNNMEPDLKTKMIESDLIQREQVSDTDRL